MHTTSPKVLLFFLLVPILLLPSYNPFSSPLLPPSKYL